MHRPLRPITLKKPIDLHIKGDDRFPCSNRGLEIDPGPNYLIKEAYLSEFKSALEKARARENLGIQHYNEWGHITGFIEEQEDLADYLSSLIREVGIPDLYIIEALGVETLEEAFQIIVSEILDYRKHKKEAHALDAEYDRLICLLDIIHEETKDAEELGCLIERVDLGLPSGNLWATKNLNSFDERDLGNFIAWGELTPKEEYTEDNCINWNVELDDIQGNELYDAATQLGERWQMPSKEDFDELIDLCTWEEDYVGGIIVGYNIIGPNGTQMYLPIGGYMSGSTQTDQVFSGRYWTSTPDENSNSTAWALDINKNNKVMINAERNLGLLIRPIYKRD